MKKIINLKISVALIMFSLIALCSCDEKEFIDRYPLDGPNPANFFSGEGSAQSAIAATFNPWWYSSGMYSRDLVIIFDAMTDDSYWRPSRSGSIQQERWDIYPTHGKLRENWERGFQSVNAANFAIEGIPTSSDPSFDEAAQQPYIAQAIEGVVKQETEYPFELIIGEDCSTDKTMDSHCPYVGDPLRISTATSKTEPRITLTNFP